MTATSKALLIITALLAVSAGFLLNKQQLNEAEQIDTSALLSAALISMTPALEKEGESNETKTTIRPLLGELNLVNFWASWCSPCREEMPMFNALYQKHQDRNFQVIGVTIDSQEKAQPLLDSMDIKYPIVYAERTGFELMEQTANPNGLLPYTLLLNKSGDMLEAKLGKLNEQQLNEWLAKHLTN